MLSEVCDTDGYITWPYHIADHNCRITWVYNKITNHISADEVFNGHFKSNEVFIFYV